MQRDSSWSSTDDDDVFRYVSKSVVGDVPRDFFVISGRLLVRKQRRRRGELSVFAHKITKRMISSTSKREERRDRRSSGGHGVALFRSVLSLKSAAFSPLLDTLDTTEEKNAKRSLFGGGCVVYTKNNVDNKNLIGPNLPTFSPVRARATVTTRDSLREEKCVRPGYAFNSATPSGRDGRETKRSWPEVD